MIRKALITGGSGGIGQAIAQRLAAAGIRVWVHYHSNPEAAAATVETIQGQGGKATALGFDVSDWEATRASLEGLLADEGAMDIVVHNAGITDDAAFPGMQQSQWQRVIDTSLNGFFHVTRPLIMPMIRQRWGRIVSIASIAALHGSRGQANYAAAKAGLIGASRSLAREVASRGICVNVVAPGYVDTGMIADIPAGTIRELVPMQRSGRADEIAAVVAFLCSDDTAYMTGEVLNVSGGII